VLACIPLEGSVLYSEIAQITVVPEAQLRSVTRMMMTSNFLCEPRPGELAHTTLSAHFVTSPALLDSAMFLTDVIMPATAKLAKATERFGATDQRNQTALNVALDTNMPFSDVLAQAPKLQRQFAAYMRNIATNDETSVNQLVAAFDWDSIRDATVVDVRIPTHHSHLSIASQVNGLLNALRSTLTITPPALHSQRAFPCCASSCKRRPTYSPPAAPLSSTRPKPCAMRRTR
jgi:6-hydroxytryprostatin B O-methyltransferase